MHKLVIIWDFEAICNVYKVWRVEYIETRVVITEHGVNQSVKL